MQNPFTIPCFFKHYFGIECPGCGFQRSLWALLQGDLAESLRLYPALIPALCTAGFLLAHLVFRFPRGAQVLTYLFTGSGLLMFGSYFVKQWLLFHG